MRKHLVVEDNIALNTLFTNVLSNDAEVLSAENGLEALALVEKHKFDIVLCDVDMPIMNGIEFCEHAIKADKDFSKHVIILTGHPSEEVQSFCRRSGILLLHKPTSLHSLKAAVNTLLAAISSSQQADTPIESDSRSSLEKAVKEGPPLPLQWKCDLKAGKTIQPLVQDHRRSRRKQLDIPTFIVTIQPQTGEVAKGTILDLSIGGIRFSVPKGTRVEIETGHESANFSVAFTLPEKRQPISLTCHPAWTTEVAEELQVGAFFVNPDSTGCNALHQYLN